MSAKHVTKREPATIFESAYGSLRGNYRWLVPGCAVIGVVGIPVGIFWNEGWKMGNTPLEPWTVTVIVEVFAVGALMIAAAMSYSARLRRESPHRVAVTETDLIVPKGLLSSVELVLPLDEVDLKVFNPGFVKQLQIKHKRRKILLSSALFPSDEDFDRLISHLPC